MDVQLVLSRLVAAAATATSTPSRKMQALDYVPDDIDPPCIFPESVEVGFDKTFGRGTDEMTVKLRLLCARTDDRAGQHMIYGYMKGSGASSVKAAIEAASGVPGVAALAGACDSLHVKAISPTRWIDHAGEKYVGVDFTVYLIGSGA